MAGSITIKVEGADALGAKLKSPLIKTAVHEAMVKAAAGATALFRSGAPSKSGALRGSAQPKTTAYTAQVTFDPVGQSRTPAPYGFIINRRGRRKGYLDKVKAAVQAGPGRQAAADIAAAIQKQFG